MTRSAFAARRRTTLLTLPRADLLALLVLLAASLLLWTLAYQVPLHLPIHVGGDPNTFRRYDDQPFLRNVNASEPESATTFEWWTLPPGYAYRWTKPDATVRIPGVGNGPWLVSVLAQSGRADGGTAQSEWQVGNRTLSLAIPADVHRYSFLADADAAGDLVLHLRTEPYVAANDPRELGFVLRDVQITSAVGNALHWPSLPVLGWLTLVVGIVYTAARWVGWRWPAALAVAFGLSSLAALLLAVARPVLTLVAPTLGLLCVACLALAAIVAGAWRLATVGALGRGGKALVALALLGFVVRLGGMLHPHALFSDHRFNANKLLEVGLGRVFLSAGLPLEAGGTEAPYPPGVYLLLLPLQLLAPTGIDGRVLLVQSGVALLDSLVIVLLGVLLIRGGFGWRAALFGAGLYLVPSPLLESFSIGEYANIGGQALALPFIALLAWHSPRGRWAWAVLAAALALGLLSHFGVALSLGLFGGCVWLVALASRGAQKSTPLAPARLAAVGFTGAAIAGVLFYSAPIYLAALMQPGGAENAASGAIGRSFVSIVGETLSIVLGVQGLNGRAPLPALLLAASVAGLALLWYSSDRRVARLRLVLSAWWLSALVSQGLLLVAGQGLRWTHFLFPALCLSAGPLLSVFWRRGMAGKVATLLVLTSTFIYGATVWLVQIRDYYHL